MFRNMMTAGCALVALTATPAVAQTQPLAVDAAAFGARETASNMDISPDGSKIVYLGPGPGVMSVVFVADVATGDIKPILRANGDPETINWCAFVGNSRLACKYSGS